MSLERYRRPRLIVMNPRVSAYDVARAMEDNHIGAVIVADAGQVVGIVTDRDLALEVLGGDHEARSTAVSSFMSGDVACVEVTDELSDVLRLMRDRRVRRVPVVERGRPVGLVTLDDLLVEGDASLEDVAAVLRAQLASPRRLKPAGVTHPVEPSVPVTSPERARARAKNRRESRAASTYGQLLHRVVKRSRLATRERAERALIVVLTGLLRRLSAHEAADLIAQLPSRLHERLYALPAGPDKSITTETIERELQRELGLDVQLAHQVLDDVCVVLRDAISAGEIEDVKAQLPREMKDIFEHAA